MPGSSLPLLLLLLTKNNSVTSMPCSMLISEYPAAAAAGFTQYTREDTVTRTNADRSNPPHLYFAARARIVDDRLTQALNQLAGNEQIQAEATNATEPTSSGSCQATNDQRVRAHVCTLLNGRRVGGLPCCIYSWQRRNDDRRLTPLTRYMYILCISD